MKRPVTSREQRNRGFVGVGGLAVILTVAPASGMSDQKGSFLESLSTTETHAASASVESPAVVAALSGKGRHAEEGGLYDPSVVYSGIFESKQIYKIVVGPETWAGSRRPARIQQVTCRDARTALERKGSWTGPLNADGACGSGEPTDWALGNFLNFQAGLEDAESDR